MKATSQKKHESIRIFESDFLEKFTHVHPLIPLVMWAPAVVYLSWRSLEVHQFSWVALLVMALSGLLFWSLFEYTLHRFVFHVKGVHPWISRFQYIIHGLHHDDPNDPTRLVMPPLPALILAVLLYSGFKFVFGPIWVDPFFAGFLVGYLSYDYTHFALHHFTPRTSVGRRLKQHHMLHHYVTHQARYGVSSSLWDHVFGSLTKSQPAVPAAQSKSKGHQEETA